MRYVAGLDIGGTKLAVTLAQLGEGVLDVQEKIRMATPTGGWRPG